MSAPTPAPACKRRWPRRTPSAASRTGRLWSGGWTTSTPPRRPSVSWAGCGSASRPAGTRPRRPTARSSRPTARAATAADPRPGRVAWKRVADAMAWYDGRRAAWQRRQALTLLQPNGHLNDRIQAKREIAAACVGLPGRPWKKVRAFLTDRRTLTFLDRAQRQVAVAEPARKCVRPWCGCGGWSGPPRPAGPRRAAAAGPSWQRWWCSAWRAPSWRRTGPSRTVVYGGCWRGWCVPPARWSA